VINENELVRQHRNPAIDRMAAILDELEKAPNGLGLKRLSERTAVTRSTVYRILNSLLAHGIVRQLENSDYVLGSRLLSLADAVVSPIAGRLAECAQPHLDRVARQVGETAKVSVFDRGHVLVVAIAPGSLSHALHAVVGEHLPAHAGGGSKALLAGLDEADMQRVISRPLTRFTDRTIIDPNQLREEVFRIREQGFSHDDGEFSLSVNSFGAEISSAGRSVGAISIPFLAGRSSEYEETIRAAVIATAQLISADLG